MNIIKQIQQINENRKSSILKSFGFSDEYFEKAQRTNHKYIRKEGNRYIYKEISSKEKKEIENNSNYNFDLKIGTNSVYYENGKIIVTDRSQLYNISDHFRAYEEYLKHDKQKYFYRATNNENEHLINNPISMNHLTGENEKGLSVHYTPVYQEKFEAGNQLGKKYIAVVTGKIVGFGSDKEPLLKNVKFVQKPVSKLPSKYSRENVVKTRQLTEKEMPWRKLNFSPFGNDVIIK